MIPVPMSVLTGYAAHQSFWCAFLEAVRQVDATDCEPG